MKDALNLRSKSGIHRLISGLEERGFIRRLPHRARALEVLKLPEESAAPVSRENGSRENGERGKFSPTVIRGDFSNALPGSTIAAESDAAELPLYGRIAAGTPIEALREETARIAVPAALLGRQRALRARSRRHAMVDAGIYDGDTVIIQCCDVAENGSIVVALVDNQEATLKRLRKRGDSIARPANQVYETRILRPRPRQGAGWLVGLMRWY